MQDLHSESYKTLLREIKDYLNNRDISYSQIRRINIVKMAILPQLIYSFDTIPIQTLAVFLIDIDKLILKCTRGKRKSSIANTILKKNKVGGVSLANSKTYKKA